MESVGRRLSCREKLGPPHLPARRCYDDSGASPPPGRRADDNNSTTISSASFIWWTTDTYFKPDLEPNQKHTGCAMVRLQTLVALGSLVLPSVTAATITQHKSSQPRRTDEDNDDTPLPLVIWHGKFHSFQSAGYPPLSPAGHPPLTVHLPSPGLGDNYAAEGLQSVGDLAEAVNPGTLVYYVRMDENPSSDRSATFLGNVTEQIAKACADIAAHPILSTAPAIDALGFSQGGQFLRAYVERCNSPPVRSLVTFGSQHNGIVAFRDCAATDWLCKGAMALLRGNTWSGFVQGRLVPAQYFRDPADYGSYLESSNFLADINNERALKNQTYRRNLARLEQLVLYMFSEDTTVVPKETSWFEEVNGTEVTPLRARRLYTEDWIGLRELDRKGGLKFRTAEGEHMRITDKVLNETFRDFYGPYGRTFARDDVSFSDEL
ncbi:uncharacterized protein E0L32_012126 [Thyridium curvatum]|uniref:palmitoyl-protein hydrolase n=1 Tax=Thyridium curvatum TaxID=1093900 RepID=A0A507BDE3_9PEZI|nr:uncharacterized protein E0L32_012126 [Thyridium curvatum]TPX17563.1 hypothetical protein E0L32_012126 [Thyridium curvatum]